MKYAATQILYNEMVMDKVLENIKEGINKKIMEELEK